MAELHIFCSFASGSAQILSISQERVQLIHCGMHLFFFFVVIGF